MPQHTNAPFFASRQSYASGVPPAPTVEGLASVYRSHESPYASTPYRPTPYPSTPYESTPYLTTSYGSTPYTSTPYESTPYPSTPYGSMPYSSTPYESTPYPTTSYGSTPYTSTPYELTTYYTPYYRSTHSGPSTLAPPAASPSVSALVPPGPSAALLLSPRLSTIQEETPTFTEMRVSPVHQKGESHGSPVQIQRSAGAQENYNEPMFSLEVTDLPPEFVPNTGREVDHSDTESGYTTSEQSRELLVDPRSATTGITNANTSTHDEGGSIRTTPAVVPDNGNMRSGGGGVQASTSSSTTTVPSSSNPVDRSTFAETPPLPRRFSRTPSSAAMATQTPVSPFQPFSPLSSSADRVPK